jgi:2-desacetyl-2-hydroxyethyl bacteriochlorophyllide A dehydrogenase
MKAAIINTWGGPDVFEIKEVEQPKPEANQLVIKVYASSINPADWKHRIGNHKYVLGAPFPIILGYDVCGEVIEVGKEIAKFKIGDIVFGDLDNKYGGALAEYAVGHENCFALKPENITTLEAAAFPLVSLTAIQALHKANIRSGNTVLINGAAGGVGHIAMQLAKIYGARVIAVASHRNKNLVESFQPDEFIDYTKQDILKLEEKVDIFFDTIGNLSFRKTRHLLNKGGTYINTLPRPKIIAHKFFQIFSGGKKVKTLLRKHSNEDLKQIADLIQIGKLKVAIDKTFKLEDIALAHTYAQKGHTIGKNVIEIV